MNQDRKPSKFAQFLLFIPLVLSFLTTVYGALTFHWLAGFGIVSLMTFGIINVAYTFLPGEWVEPRSDLEQNSRKAA